MKWFFLSLLVPFAFFGNAHFGAEHGTAALHSSLSLPGAVTFLVFDLRYSSIGALAMWSPTVCVPSSAILACCWSGPDMAHAPAISRGLQNESVDLKGRARKLALWPHHVAILARPR